jgi:phosphatidylglycerophosphatase A
MATFFGIGYFPLAPGTLTSLIVVLMYKFFLHQLSWPIHLLVFLGVFLAGTIASDRMSAKWKTEDPQKVVIDEAAGQYLALFQLSASWWPLLLSFLLFRLFDILKPFPIRRIESFPRGWGIMLDDFVAALYAGIIVYVYLILR